MKLIEALVAAPTAVGLDAKIPKILGEAEGALSPYVNEQGRAVFQIQVQSSVVPS